MARRSDHSREELYDMALEAARQIAEKEGLRGLKARRIARDIGYTIGTLYNLFEDLDDLIVHLNGRTLDDLYQAFVRVKLDGERMKGGLLPSCARRIQIHKHLKACFDRCSIYIS